MALVMLGKVVTFDAARPVVDDGAIYIGELETGGTRIEAVQPADAAPPAGYDAVPRVRTDGVIYPGLVDLHNHLAYDYRSLWFPPRAEPYTARDQWPRAAGYSEEISKPTALLGTVAAKAVLKFAEVKAAVAGVTSVQGSPGLSRPYEGWLVRNVEHETFGTGTDLVYQSVRTLGPSDLRTYRDHLAEGAVFIYHLAEGTDPRLVSEFDDLNGAGCLQPGLVGIHATALGMPEFDRLGSTGGAMVWSPFSNLWLYRDTTDVVAAAKGDVRICLGADWGPSGSKNVLGELKVADLWNRTHLGRAFSDRELCEMVTVNPGLALARAWGERIGQLRPGLEADLVVMLDRHPDPYRNLIESTEHHVRLVVVGGRPVYGNTTLMRAAGVGSPEPITVSGVVRSIAMLDPAIADADMSWAQVLASLEHAREDPAGTAAWTLAATAAGEPPLRLIPDMPGGELTDVLAAGDLGPVVVPPIDSLAHDAAFFEALSAPRAPILGGLLDDLRAYYADG